MRQHRLSQTAVRAAHLVDSKMRVIAVIQVKLSVCLVERFCRVIRRMLVPTPDDFFDDTPQVVSVVAFENSDMSTGN